MSKMTKKFCPSPFISQEPYIIWLSFMVHLCKMVISPGVFFLHFFNIWIFWVFRGLNKGQKEIPRFTQPSSHLCDFIYFLIIMLISSIVLLVWSNSWNCVYWLVSFNFIFKIKFGHSKISAPQVNLYKPV